MSHYLEVREVDKSLVEGVKKQQKLGEFCGFLSQPDFSKDKAYLICWGK